MRFRLRTSIHALPLLLALLLGCDRTPVPTASPLKVAGPSEDKKQKDVIEAACAVLGQASEGPQLRDALHMLADHMNSAAVRQQTRLGPEQRAFLTDQAHLLLDEVAEVESGVFRPLDGYYLESCFLFRDIARGLEKTGLPRVDRVSGLTAVDKTGTPGLDLPRHALGWVCRQVLLDGPPGNSWVPPHLIVKRGFGSPSDRALVLLSLLRQFNLEGCVLASKHPLVGVLIKTKKEENLYLFDPVYGRPVPGPDGKGVATLAQVRQDPKLLEAGGIAGEDFKDSKYYLNCPLNALALRMKVLEDLLPEQPVVLYMDAAKVAGALAGLIPDAVRIGNPPPESKMSPRNSPTRSLRFFLPPSEGGVDAVGQQLTMYRDSLRPMPQVYLQLGKWNLLFPNVHPEVTKILERQIEDIFAKFALQPREMILRGQTSAALKRLERVRPVLEDLEFTSLDDAAFLAELFQFRDLAKEAYLKDPSKKNELWGKDQFFHALMKVDEDLDLKKVAPDKQPLAPERKFLTRLLFGACKDQLGQKIKLLMAQSLQEKAEALQATADYKRSQGLNAADAEARAQQAWPDVKDNWSKYLERHGVAPENLKARVNRHAEHWHRVVVRDEKTGQFKDWKPQEMGSANYQLLLRDWTAACTARLNLAYALEREGQHKRASQVLDVCAKDLARLAEDADLEKGLEKSNATVKSTLDALAKLPPPFPKLPPPYVVEYQKLMTQELRGKSATMNTLTRMVEMRQRQLLKSTP